VARRYISPAGSALSEIWDQLDESTQRNVVAEIRAGLALVRAAAEDRDDWQHPPVRTTHAHWHPHDADSGVRGLDSEGGHTHQHSHGKAASALHPLELDNSHDHLHDAAGLEHRTGEENRLNRVRILNAAPRPDAWDALARLGAQLERGHR
jgi:hypothetical protein